MIHRIAPVFGLVFAVVGCSSASGTALDLPLISPPVHSATPPGLDSTDAATRLDAPRLAAELSVGELVERFFSGSGPTDVMTLLHGIDLRLEEIGGGAGRPACADLPPVPYTITPLGRAVELVAQCYRDFGTASGEHEFLQFGERDGVISLYAAVGAARLAAILTPIAGTTDRRVDAWYGVGYLNKVGCGGGRFDDCSYAVAALSANPVTRAFEMSVAGVGVGFCGVQFASDGTRLYGVGSTDMGSTCNHRATLCVSAVDLSPAVCDAPSYTLPAVGRRAGAGGHAFGASHYPDVPNVTLDGTAADSLSFGPLAPTPGAGDLAAR